MDKRKACRRRISVQWHHEYTMGHKRIDKLAHVQKAYSSILNNVTCFACERFCVPYPPTDSKIQKAAALFTLGQSELNKAVYISCEKVSHPLDLHFEMSDENPKELCFNHPITGIKHTLYFQKPEQFSIKTGKNRNLYIMQSMYEIEPALPQGDTLQFGNSIQYTEPLNDEFSSTSAASIGIIGGADGPTAIYISSKKEKEVSRGLHGLPPHSCLSVPCFQKEETSHFVLEGINTKDLDSKEYNFQCRY